MDKAELLRRTKNFALRVLKLVEQLPKNVGGRATANQLVRSATSIGANYRAACRGRNLQQNSAPSQKKRMKRCIGWS
ncbi:MAG: four helix bundle protein [Verrucomicrobiota bacterium]